MFDPINVPVMGNLVNEPQARVVPNTDKEIVSFRVAVDQGYWDREKREEVKTGTTFLSVACHGSLGQNVLASQYKPGTRLLIFGQLSTKEYETKEGQPRTDVKVKATDVGPSNLWTPARVPERGKRDTGGRPREDRGGFQGGGYGSFQGGDDNWKPQYRDTGRTAQPAASDDPWAQPVGEEPPY